MRAVIPATEIELDPPRIIAVPGAASADIQELFADLAIMWRTAGLSVGGVLDQAVPHFMSGHQVERVLFDIASGARYPVTQKVVISTDTLIVRNDDGGWRASSHGLNAFWRRNEAPGFAAACYSVENAIQRGCHVVIMSKFGKSERDGGGMCAAFQAAFDAGVPVLTSVSPCAEEAWIRFTRGMAAFVQPDQQDIETWRSALARADFRARMRAH